MKERVDVAPHSRALSVQRAYTSGTLQHAWKLSLLHIMDDVWSERNWRGWVLAIQKVCIRFLIAFLVLSKSFSISIHKTP